MLAELVGEMARDFSKLPPSGRNIIKEWLNKIAEVFGLKKPFTRYTSDRETTRFLNNLAEALATGTKLTEGEIDINDDVINGVVDVGNIKPRESKLLDELDLERLPYHQDAIVVNDFDLKSIDGQRASSTLSDRLVAGRLGEHVTFGGIMYPAVTGRFWAAGKQSSANKIVNESQFSKDGYRYLIPAIMSDVSHMSNRDMSQIAMDLMREAAANGEINRSEFKKNVLAAFSKIKTKKYLPEAKAAIAGRISVMQMIDNVKDLLTGPVMDVFEVRKDVLKTLIGEQGIKGPRYPTVGNMSDLARQLEEPLAAGAALHQVVSVIRTKGDLSVQKSSKSDPLHHDSYPFYIDSTAPVETLLLDGVYSLTDIIPEFETATGTQSTEKALADARYKGRPEAALRNLGRTHGLASYSAPVHGIADKVTDRQQITEELQSDDRGPVIDAFLEEYAKSGSERKALNRAAKVAPEVPRDMLKQMFHGIHPSLFRNEFVEQDFSEAFEEYMDVFADDMIEDLKRGLEKYPQLQERKEAIINQMEKYLKDYKANRFFPRELKQAMKAVHDAVTDKGLEKAVNRLSQIIGKSTDRQFESAANAWRKKARKNLHKRIGIQPGVRQTAGTLLDVNPRAIPRRVRGLYNGILHSLATAPAPPPRIMEGMNRVLDEMNKDYSQIPLLLDEVNQAIAYNGWEGKSLNDVLDRMAKEYVTEDGGDAKTLSKEEVDLVKRAESFMDEKIVDKEPKVPTQEEIEMAKEDIMGYASEVSPTKISDPDSRKMAYEITRIKMEDLDGIAYSTLRQIASGLRSAANGYV
ncbi:MAG: hypothetical protein ACXADO_11700, partial [Candidatus Thorarchaeota archaeon]